MMARGNVSRYSKKYKDATIGAAKLLLDSEREYLKYNHKTFHVHGETYIGYDKRSEVCKRVKLGKIKTNYDVTISGNIYNRITGHRLEPCINGHHYYVLIYYKEPGMPRSVRKEISIHRLVAIAFIKNPKQKKEVHHIDGNPLNNNVSNLMWVTNREHNDIHQAMGKFKKSARYGEDNNFTKATNETILAICDEFKKNKLTPPQIAKKYKVDKKTVRLILHKKQWTHLTKNMDFSMYDKLRVVSQSDKDKVIELIKTTDLSLKEISKITGVSHTYVSHMNRQLNLRKKNLVVKRSTTRERLS